MSDNPFLPSTQRYEPNEKERKVAALAHAGLLLTGGLAAPIIWLMFRQNSAYVTRHAARAALAQIGGMAAIFLLGPITCGLGYLLALPLVGFSLWEANNAWKGRWDAFQRKQIDG